MSRPCFNWQIFTFSTPKSVTHFCVQLCQMNWECKQKVQYEMAVRFTDIRAAFGVRFTFSHQSEKFRFTALCVTYNENYRTVELHNQSWHPLRIILLLLFLLLHISFSNQTVAFLQWCILFIKFYRLATIQLETILSWNDEATVSICTFAICVIRNHWIRVWYVSSQFLHQVLLNLRSYTDS